MWISLGGTYCHGYCTLHHSLWPYMQLPNPESIWACDWAAYFSHSLFNFVAVHSLSHVQLFVTPWTAALQASLSFTNSRSLLKLMSIELVMPSNHLSLCHPILLLPSVFPSTRVFSNELALCIRWPKYWSFSFSISPFSEYSGCPTYLNKRYLLIFNF